MGKVDVRQRPKRHEFDTKISVVISEAIERSGLDIDTQPELVEQVVGKAIDRGSKNASDVVVRSLFKAAPRMLRRRRRDERKWRRQIRKYWGEAFNIYRMLLVACHEVGEAFDFDHRPPDTEPFPPLANAMLGLQARAVQVALDVLTLLENGLGQGALGRARTLHEIAVAACVLSEQRSPGTNPDLAERFLDHQIVSTRKDARQYQDNADAIGYEKFTDDEMKEFEDSFERVKTKYGSEFCKDNGWAAVLNGGSAPTFRRLEELASMSHLRSHYAWASHEVHADSKGWQQNIGEWDGVLYRSTGGTLSGLADPAHMAAIALNNVTLSLIMCTDEGPDTESLIVMRVLTQLVDRVGDASIEAHRRVEALGGSSVHDG
ncbi:DUF5677 domain-containing protein [Aeromicrobium sp.]|uniref:DUF5677 domain-containing protein n=1 Tax=Aeromicrobium sp. TaxID=1871063 RepID=UPI002FC858E7